MMPTQPQLVVVIDDSATMRKIVEVCLSREGYAVRGFVDGVEALRWISGPEGYIPALIFLDIELPNGNGYEVARHVRQNPAFAQTLIVMLSRHNGVIDRLKGRLAGASMYLTKPCTIHELVAVTSGWIGVPLSEKNDTYYSAASR
jgi:twitching motility two-component system response regulator PilG